MRRLAFTTLLVSCLIAPVAMAQAPDWKKIRVGVEGNYPPFSKLGVDGKLSGFDIDVAMALCAKLKAECTLVQQEWDGMMPALNAKKFDMIVASMTITEERKKAADFTDAYYDVPSRWIAKTGTITGTTPADLKGKKIVVLRNSPRARLVADQYKDSEVLLAAKENDVYLELASGRADIALGSSVVSAEAFLKKPEGKGFQQVGETFRIPGDSGAGIAVRKGDTALREKLNAALKEIKADGTYKKLNDKYFDFDVSGGNGS